MRVFILFFSDVYETASEGSFDISTTAIEVPSSVEDDGEIEDADLWSNSSTIKQRGSCSTPVRTPCGSPHKSTINDYLNDLMDAALMPSTSQDIKSQNIKQETESNSDPMEEDLDYDDILDFDDDWS